MYSREPAQCGVMHQILGDYTTRMGTSGNGARTGSMRMWMVARILLGLRRGIGGYTAVELGSMFRRNVDQASDDTTRPKFTSVALVFESQ